jgi:hypothetical protein
MNPAHLIQQLALKLDICTSNTDQMLALHSPFAVTGKVLDFPDLLATRAQHSCPYRSETAGSGASHKYNEVLAA